MKQTAEAYSDVVAPLLPEVGPSAAKKASAPSVSGAVFNVSTSIIGAGIMSIPATVKVLGIGPALAMIVVVAVLADISVEFLLRFTEYSAGGAVGATTYARLMGESFGRVGSLLVQLAVLVATWGCLIIYLIIIGDVLSGNRNGESVHLGVLQEWFGQHWWNDRAYALLLIVVFILLPLVLLRRVESLRFTSAISVLLAVVFVGISTVMAISALLQGNTQTPRFLPNLNSPSSFFELFTAIPVIVTAFTFHFNVHPIAAELHQPSHMVLACRISLVLCATIYFAVGFFGYLLFGDSIMPDILVNFDRSTGSAVAPMLNDLVRLSYALHLVLVFPLINFSLRANIDEFLFQKKPPLCSDTMRLVSLTSIILGLTYFVAIVFPDIWLFFQFIGCTSTVSMAFIFPAAIVLRDIHGITTGRDRIIALGMMILAVITSTIAIATNVYNLGGSSS